MRTLKQTFIKYPLATLFCLAAVSTVSPRTAIAGNQTVSPPDSGGVNVSDTFAPDADDSSSSGGSDPQTIAAQISAGIASTVSSLRATGTVPSVDGTELSISEAKIDTIVAAVSTTGAGSEAAIDALEQQLASELGAEGFDLDITILGNTPTNLQAAISAANSVILSLDSAQLAAAIQSPTFMAILQMLGGAVETVDGELVIVTEEGGVLGLPLLAINNI
ncbi:MAG: hypothetical protein ACFB0D_16525 [Phormidesmis sp.]